MTSIGQEPYGLVYSSILSRARDVRVRVMREDIVVNRPEDRFVRGLMGRIVGPRNPRGDVREMTQKSANRMMQTVRNLEGLKYMVTLTYPDDWRWSCATHVSRLVRPYGESVARPSALVSKEHFRVFRMWLTRRSVSGMWFVEFQQRGAPHYHLYIDRSVNKTDLSAAWYKIVGAPDIKHLMAGTNIRPIWGVYGAQKYLAKYAAKERQKVVPPEFGGSFGRLWGTIKCRIPYVELEGRSKDLAPALRVFREVAKRRKYNSFAAKGRERGFTLYGDTREPLRYLAWLLDSSPKPTVRLTGKRQRK